MKKLALSLILVGTCSAALVKDLTVTNNTGSDIILGLGKTVLKSNASTIFKNFGDSGSLKIDGIRYFVILSAGATIRIDGLDNNGHKFTCDSAKVLIIKQELVGHYKSTR